MEFMTPSNEKPHPLCDHLRQNKFVEKRFRQKEGTYEKNIGVHNHFDGADCLHNAPEAGDN
jgi:hypothetical protein